RGRDVERLVAESGDRAVVDDPAAVGREHAVADAPNLEVAEAVRVEPLEERDRIRPGDEQLPERGNVDHADVVVHALRLARRIAVVVRPLPRTRPDHLRTRLDVAPTGPPHPPRPPPAPPQ